MTRFRRNIKPFLEVLSFCKALLYLFIFCVENIFYFTHSL